MGTTSSLAEPTALAENPTRKVFVRYLQMIDLPGGLFGKHVEFYFKISYYRFSFEIGIRYNELIAFEKQLVRKFPEQMSSIERLTKSSKFLASHDSKFLEHRAKIMTRFLQLVCDIDSIFSVPLVYKFFKTSVTAFQSEYGKKGKEGFLKKSSGGYHEKFSGKMGDYIRVWRWRWIVLHDNCMVWYASPDNREMLGALQIDADFGVAQAGRVITLKTGTRRLTFFAANTKIAREWVLEFQKMYSNRLVKHFYDSSYAARMKNEVRVYCNGCEYYQAVAVALLTAQKEIFITSWKNSPTVLLTRPPLPPLRLDHILKYKADQGVQIFVLLYKEVEHIGQGNDSFNVMKKLEGLSPNIHCIRHPNKFMGGSTAVLWSHHEKLVVVDRNMAFIGGIDLAFQRWDDEHHHIVDEDGLL
jgi:phospholipase D1/2